MRRGAWPRRALLALGVLVAFPLGARAQGTCTANVGSKCSSAITVSTPNATTLANPRYVALTSVPNALTWTVGSADLTAGTTSTEAYTLTISSNTSWKIYVQGAAGTLPVASVRWGTSAAAVTQTLTTSPVLVASGSRGTDLTVTVYARAIVSWTGSAPGDSSVPVTFTVSSP